HAARSPSASSSHVGTSHGGGGGGGGGVTTSPSSAPPSSTGVFPPLPEQDAKTKVSEIKSQRRAKVCMDGLVRKTSPPEVSRCGPYRTARRRPRCSDASVFFRSSSSEPRVHRDGR